MYGSFFFSLSFSQVAVSASHVQHDSSSLPIKAVAPQVGSNHYNKAKSAPLSLIPRLDLDPDSWSLTRTSWHRSHMYHGSSCVL